MLSLRAKTHKHLPGLCKAVVINLLVMNSPVEAHFERIACAFLLPAKAVQAIVRVFRGEAGTIAVR